MKTLELIKNRKEDNNGFANLLAKRAGVEDYYTEDYNEAAGGGMDFDLMYDCDNDKFFAVDSGWGGTYEQQNNCIFIYQCISAESEEELEKAVDIYLERQTNTGI